MAHLSQRREVIDAVLWKLGWRRRSSSARHRAIFTRVYRRREWGGGESASGPGSTIARAAAVGADVLRLLSAFDVSSVVDAPCGDFNWMRTVFAQRSRTSSAAGPRICSRRRSSASVETSMSAREHGAR